MNTATADHLTNLFRAAAPIECRELTDNSGTRPEWFHPSLGWQYIRDIIAPIADLLTPTAQAEEIRAAARERREAKSYVCHISHQSSSSAAWHPYGGFAMILLGICRPEIDAAIATDNARRLAEYEAYRAACEQGVAVPPPAK